MYTTEMLYVHLVLYPHGIAHTSSKFYSGLPGAGFYFYYIHQGKRSDKERKIEKLSAMHTKRFNTYFKRWVQLIDISIVQFHVYPLIHQFFLFTQMWGQNKIRRLGARHFL